MTDSLLGFINNQLENSLGTLVHEKTKLNLSKNLGL